MSNRSKRYIRLMCCLLILYGSLMRSDTLLNKCGKIIRAPFVFCKATVRSFKKEVAGSSDINDTTKDAGDKLGAALGRSVTSIPERAINTWVDQACAAIPWMTLWGMAGGYIKVPDGIKNCILDHKKPLIYTTGLITGAAGIYWYYTDPAEEGEEAKTDNQHSVIDTKSPDAEFVNNLPLTQEEKNILKNRFEQIATIGGQREKASLAVIKGLPWNKYTQDNTDIAQAKKILEDSHYGLDKIKKQILNYIAVRHLNQNACPPILCLVGPPGVGKTSIARTIARCLGRHHDLIACGTITEKSRLVGVAPAYVGAQEGLLIKAIKRTESMNPVFILDEVDKMSEQAMEALISVLDTQQNTLFRDHFVDIPCDLSKTLPIITVNDLKRLPLPLQDRMHIITIEPFKEHEKLAIAQRFLVRKAINYAGLDKYASKLEEQLNENVIRHVITHYTQEAGVRDLERALRSLCAEVARVIVEHKRLPEITIETLPDLIGNPPVH